jgi:hypothetical protein
MLNVAMYTMALLKDEELVIKVKRHEYMTLFPVSASPLCMTITASCESEVKDTKFCFGVGKTPA